MDRERLKTFSEELRETRLLARAAEKHAGAAARQAEAAMIEAKAAGDHARASWEVVITRNQVREEIAYLMLPWWKKLFGATS